MLEIQYVYSISRSYLIFIKLSFARRGANAPSSCFARGVRGTNLITGRSLVDRPIDSEIEREIIRQALLWPKLEERLLELYNEGKLYGTVHTIGQEFSGAVITEFLQPGDAVFSNHRCHGHFLSFTDNVRSLIAEIMGKTTVVCGSRGGSQHCQDGFYANGIEGGIVLATGLTLARKFDR